MSKVHLWGALISLLLIVNAFFLYRSALVYGKLPQSQMTDQQSAECMEGEAKGLGEYNCPHGWYLKGTE